MFSKDKLKLFLIARNQYLMAPLMEAGRSSGAPSGSAPPTNIGVKTFSLKVVFIVPPYPFTKDGILLILISHHFDHAKALAVFGSQARIVSEHKPRLGQA